MPGRFDKSIEIKQKPEAVAQDAILCGFRFIVSLPFHASVPSTTQSSIPKMPSPGGAEASCLQMHWSVGFPHAGHILPWSVE